MRNKFHVELLRGQGYVLSGGLATLAAKLTARGHTCREWAYHQSSALWNELQDRGDDSTILIGHSLGANHAVHLSRNMNQVDIDIPLLVLFDAVGDDGYKPLPRIPTSVSTCLNYLQKFSWMGYLEGKEAYAVDDHVTVVHNMLQRLGPFGHVLIDKQEALHDNIIDHVETLEVWA